MSNNLAQLIVVIEFSVSFLVFFDLLKFGIILLLFLDFCQYFEDLESFFVSFLIKFSDLCKAYFSQVFYFFYKFLRKVLLQISQIFFDLFEHFFVKSVDFFEFFSFFEKIFVGCDVVFLKN